ncbi:MAG: hypothetical protein ACREJN_21580 [Nitrospiraceae bacterium]
MLKGSDTVITGDAALNRMLDSLKGKVIATAVTHKPEEWRKKGDAYLKLTFSDGSIFKAYIGKHGMHYFEETVH